MNGAARFLLLAVMADQDKKERKNRGVWWHRGRRMATGANMAVSILLAAVVIIYQDQKVRDWSRLTNK